MKNISILGIDLAKHVFQLHGVNKSGKAVLKKRLSRSELKEFVANLPTCLIAMEACSGSHAWARMFERMGHKVKVISPQYVKPFVQVHKNDMRDAAAIAMAASHQGVPSVMVKSEEQLDLQAIHRVRERLVREKTAIGNELRGILADMGVIIPTGHASIRVLLPSILEDAEQPITYQGRQLLSDLREQWLETEAHIHRYDVMLQTYVKENEDCKKLLEIPGIGPVNASLLLSYAGDAKRFASARHFAASLGLVPKQASSGGKNRLLGISKRGNKHVRKQLVHGARSAYRVLLKEESSGRLSDWAKRMKDSGKHVNKIVVALANKMARIVWCLMMKETNYQR